MSPLVLFCLVFCSQLTGGLNTPLPPPSYGDGGGIRGLIPAAVLHYLDKTLKFMDRTASLAHYFDVISGTDTGGLMTAMLAAPSSYDPNHPLFTPSEVALFCKKYGPEIFKPRPIWDPIKCPKYDGVFIRNITSEILKDTRLSETLTNVVIPSFDEKKVKPVVFSKLKLKTEAYLNAKLSDICVATSAAPTLLPSHQFENDGVQFDLVDGAIAANNPAMAAVSEVIQEHHAEKEILLLSLGTGIPKAKDKLGDDNDDDSCLLRWLGEHSDTISEVISKTDMTHSYLATIFPGLFPAENYLRIEEYNLDPSMGAVDNTTEENMDSLVKVGNALLDKKAKRMNVNTFVTFKLHQTNAMALDMLAEKLYAERQLRLKRKSMEKGGRSFTETI